ncbi:MAG: hypothetical protein WAL63_19725 [Solirubrobacteraceae bacterium]
MAVLELQADQLVVRLTPLEKMAAFRGDVRVPLDALRRICTDDDPWSALRGMRAPGTGIPGVVDYGVRRRTGLSPDFVAVHGRGPAIRVELGPGAPFGRMLITVPDPATAVAAIRSGVTSRPHA